MGKSTWSVSQQPVSIVCDLLRRGKLYAEKNKSAVAYTEADDQHGFQEFRAQRICRTVSAARG